MTELRTVVIGYGVAGRQYHHYLITLTPGLTLHGVASSNPQVRSQLVAEVGCHVYERYDQVFDDPEVDLVVLATPNSTHAALAIQALRAGKHVVTEKLMCLTLEEYERMIQAAKQSGKLLSVFQNRRWDGDFLTVRQLIEDGALGQVRWLEMAWQSFGPRNGWRGQLSMGGGDFYDRGAHLFDQLLLLFPQAVTSVYYRCHYDFPNHDTPSHTLVTVGFEDGATAVCDLSSLAAISKPRFYVCGTKATFVKYGLDPQDEAMKAGDIDAAIESEATSGRLHDGFQETIVPTLAGRWRNYYENIMAVLTKGAEPAVKLSESYRVIALLNAARRSAQSNQVVETNI